MDSQNHQKMKDKVAEDHQPAGKGGGGQQARQQILQPSSTASPPPSTSSSPTHEFSFTIPFQQPPTVVPDKAKAPPPSIAVDLSPADEIFFHGHLLPLHLLSHLPVSSPRSSTNSLDSFTPPITERVQDQNQNKTKSNTNTNNNSSIDNNETKEKQKPKSKSFSLFGQSRRREGFEVRDRNEEKEKQKRKLRLDLSHVVKRYMRMFSPLLSFRWRRKNNIQLRRQPYSFSGNLSSPRGKKELRGRRGEFSAPESMRTSPTDSGHLLPAGIFSSSNSSTSESTMEELQAAIQAAIAHCKNSIATDETKSKPNY